jgi:hypothetical protein
MTMDNLSWLGLELRFWTKFEIKLCTVPLETSALAEIANQSRFTPPHHEFGHPQYPLH